MFQVIVISREPAGQCFGILMGITNNQIALILSASDKRKAYFLLERDRLQKFL